MDSAALFLLNEALLSASEQPDPWQSAWDSHRTAYRSAEKKAFTAMVKVDPWLANEAMLADGFKAYEALHGLAPAKRKQSREETIVNQQADLWRNVSPALYRQYSRQVITTTLARIGFNLLPKMCQPAFHPLLQEQLSKLFTYKQEIAWERSKTMGCTPYEAAMREYNPEYGEEKLQANIGVITKMTGKIRAGAQSAQNHAGPFKANAPQTKIRGFFSDIVQSIGLPMDKVRIYASSSPAAQGSPDGIQLANHFGCSNFMTLVEDGVHEIFHGLHKFNLPDQRSPCGIPLSTGLDEGIAYFGENKIFETDGYTAFLAHKVIKEVKGDPAIWHAENMRKYHKNLRFNSNRLECCDVGNWMHLVNLIAIERDILNGQERPENYYPRWKDATGKSFGRALPENAFHYTRNFQNFAGLIGNFPGYIEGTMLAAQFFEAAQQQLPNMEADLAKGDLRPVAHWLNTNIHNKGSLLPIDALCLRATGQKRQTESYQRIVTAKYGLASG